MRAGNFIASLVAALFLVAATGASAEAVSTPRTEASLLADVATITPSKPFWVLLHIKLKEEWHTYWQNPGDSGISPILKWTLPSGFKAGEISYQPPERLPTGPLMDYGYNNDAYYLIPITPPALMNENATVILMLKAQWLVCKDVCVPEKADLSLVLPVTPAKGEPQLSEDAPLIEGLVKSLPVPLTDTVAFQPENGDVRFNVKLPKKPAAQSASFFPVTDGIIANNAKQAFSVNGDTVSFTIKQGENTELSEGEGLVTVTEDGSLSSYSIKLQKGIVPVIGKAASAPVKEDTITLSSAVLLALLGGLILNLMPCVLPILSLKVLSVAKKAKSHASQVRKQALAYTAGVVLSFMLLALLLIALQHILGSSLGWGFQMQSPVFVALLSVLMFLVGLNLSGAFELPVLFGNVGSEKASQDNALGSFLTGVLAVLVATPCTAPFMGPAIGFALTQGTTVVLSVFAALGFGLAAPFLLLSIFPRLASFLPRPGAWMLTLRQFLAFPIYITVVWLLWVLASEAGPNGVSIAMLAMVAAVFCIFLAERKSMFLKLLAMMVAVAGVWGILHFVKMMPRGQAAVSELSEPYSAERLAELRKQGRAVFVDATADWCITCKVNEAVALNKPEVKAVFAKHNIITLVADWTNGDMNITKYLKSFDRSGVPIYVYYPPKGEPKLLPQLLTPAIVIEALQNEAGHE